MYDDLDEYDSTYADRVDDTARSFMEEGMDEEDAYEMARSVEPKRAK